MKEGALDGMTEQHGWNRPKILKIVTDICSNLRWRFEYSHLSPLPRMLNPQ